MKIYADAKEILDITDEMKQVMGSVIISDNIDEEIEKKIQWVINHYVEVTRENLIRQWMPRLKSENASLPTNDEEICSLIFSHAEYRDAKSKENNPRL